MDNPYERYKSHPYNIHTYYVRIEQYNNIPVRQYMRRGGLSLLLIILVLFLLTYAYSLTYKR